MFKLFLIYCLATFVASIEHKCNFQSQPELDIQGLRGWWNLQQMTGFNTPCENCNLLKMLKSPSGIGNPWPDPLEPCISLQFKDLAFHENYTHAGILHYNFFGSHIEWDYGINAVRENNNIKLLATPNDRSEDSQDIQVLHTDYLNTALIATCFQETRFVGMLSRRKEPLSEDIVKAYVEIAARNGFTDEFWSYDHMHKDCDGR